MKSINLCEWPILDMFYDLEFWLHVYVHYVQTIIYTYTSLSHVPSCILFCGLFMFGICMYTIICSWHTYALKLRSIMMISMFDCVFHDVWWFHILDELSWISWFIIVSYLDDFHIELKCQFSWWYVFHNTCTLNLLDVFPLSLIHIWRCRRSTLCRSRWSPYH